MTIQPNFIALECSIADSYRLWAIVSSFSARRSARRVQLSARLRALLAVRRPLLLHAGARPRPRRPPLPRDASARPWRARAPGWPWHARRPALRAPPAAP